MTPLLAYFGPETVLPATSIIATVVGVVLMMGKNSIRWGIGLVRSAIGRKPAAQVPAPHFAPKAESRVADEVCEG